MFVLRPRQTSTANPAPICNVARVRFHQSPVKNFQEIFGLLCFKVRIGRHLSVPDALVDAPPPLKGLGLTEVEWKPDQAQASLRRIVTVTVQALLLKKLADRMRWACEILLVRFAILITAGSPHDGSDDRHGEQDADKSESAYH